MPDKFKVEVFSQNGIRKLEISERRALVSRYTGGFELKVQSKYLDVLADESGVSTCRQRYGQ